MGRRLASKLPNTMRRDPGEKNVSFFGYVDLPSRGEPPLITPEIEFHPGRRGAAERDLTIEKDELIHISLSGWFTDKVSLTYAQASVVRDALNRLIGYREPYATCLRCNHIVPGVVENPETFACPYCTERLRECEDISAVDPPLMSTD